MKKMILICITVIFAAILLAGCLSRPDGGKEPSQKPAQKPAQEQGSAGCEAYAVKTALKELTSVDPEKGIGVYGRYTELTAEGDVPEVLSRALAEVNARAKESVETKAGLFLAENKYPVLADGASVTEPYRYHNISYITNVTRADGILFSILETEMESGIGGAEGEAADAVESCAFHASVYDTESGRALTPADFLQDPGSLPERLKEALANKYAGDGPHTGIGQETPAWTADYLGLRFYFDGAAHVSLPYAALDGPLADAAAVTPEGFIAQIEKNTDYALPHDRRSIRVEKAADENGKEAYRIVIRDGGNESAWWLEYADDASDFYVFRAQGAYYFYRLDDAKNQAFVYNFASPDGGFGRFENQNAQCFDSFLHELCLAVPCDPDCVHMREKTRKVLSAASRLNTSFVPNGHYAFLPEKGRGRTWLHFSLIDDALALDSRNVGVRLLHELRAAALDDAGQVSGETLIPAGEVLRFLSVDGESEMYYYMSPQYSMYRSGARDYAYDCALSGGKKVRVVTRYENSFFVDGMYLDRIGEPVTLGAAQYEAGSDGLPEHSVEIGGKEYPLIRDLSLQTEAGEEIDFGGDLWWEAENYVGTFTSEEEDAKLVIAESGEVSFAYQGRQFTGKLPEKRYYRCDAEVFMEAGDEERTFRIIVEDPLPPHDPSFQRIRFYSEGLPATNEPSKVPPIEAELVRETR